jgi:hypothetical protein
MILVEHSSQEIHENLDIGKEAKSGQQQDLPIQKGLPKVNA